MREALKTMDTNASMAFWDMQASGSITHAHVVNVLKSRWGGIYHAKAAARHGHTYYASVGGSSAHKPGACPLCGLPDSTTHILGECRAHKPLHIQRHDTTGRCLIHHIRKGAKGRYPMVADVGSKDKLSPLGVENKVLQPEWLAPRGQRFTPSRIDVGLIETRLASLAMRRPLQSGTHIRLVELGYRKDYDPHKTKQTEKTAQHADMCTKLAARRYNIDFQVWDIGYLHRRHPIYT
jgi:hypothetical protein